MNSPTRIPNGTLVGKIKDQIANEKVPALGVVNNARPIELNGHVVGWVYMVNGEYGVDLMFHHELTTDAYEGRTGH